MMFSVCTWIQCSQEPLVKAEEISLLSTPQIVTGAMDLVAIVGILALAGLILANNAHSIHLPGLTSITNQTAYILIGASAGVVLIDFVAFAIQTCKKFNAISEKLKTQHEDLLVIEDNQKQNPDTQVESQRTKVLLNLQTLQTIGSAHLEVAKHKLERLPQEAELVTLQKNQAEEPEIIATQVKLLIDGSKQNCPCIDDGNLYVSNTQAELMNKDPYLKNYVSKQFDTTIEDGELFLSNLSIFLNPSINALCQTVPLGSIQLQSKIVKCEEEFSDLFAQLGLSKDKAFIHHNGDAIGVGLQTVLNNLQHANLMGNKVLVAFWCQALRTHMPFDECIDLFSQILESHLQHPEYLHEILFECLVKNHNKLETQTFLQNNAVKLHINTLNLNLLLEIVEQSAIELPNKKNQDSLDKFLKVIDLESVEVLSHGHAVWQSAEFAYVLGKCNKCVCIREDESITGRHVTTYRDLKKRIPVIDLSNYTWRRDGLNAEDGVLVFKKVNSQQIGLFYLKGHEEVTNKYLMAYYGTTLTELAAAQDC